MSAQPSIRVSDDMLQRIVDYCKDHKTWDYIPIFPDALLALVGEVIEVRKAQNSGETEKARDHEPKR